jgi:hypothetical protein
MTILVASLVGCYVDRPVEHVPFHGNSHGTYYNGNQGKERAPDSDRRDSHGNLEAAPEHR